MGYELQLALEPKDSSNIEDMQCIEEKEGQRSPIIVHVTNEVMRDFQTENLPGEDDGLKEGQHYSGSIALIDPRHLQPLVPPTVLRLSRTQRVKLMLGFVHQ